jgi:hypothetical protein
MMPQTAVEANAANALLLTCPLVPVVALGKVPVDPVEDVQPTVRPAQHLQHRTQYWYKRLTANVQTTHGVNLLLVQMLSSLAP